jgi:histidine triad (HIT) family protein
LNDCLFCRIAARETRAVLVHEDDEIVAFRDIHPQAPVHLLIVPRRHIESLGEAAEADAALLGKILLAAKDLAVKEGIDSRGWRLVTNRGRGAGQSVFHLHFHLLGGRGMGWPPG